VRLLHLAPRLNQRGGGDQYLLCAIEALADRHHQALIVGRTEDHLAPPCALSEVAGLDGSGLDGHPVDILKLERELERFGPDMIHLHGLVHPELLEWASGRPSLLTVQDHRLFCPGRGKWTAKGEVCRRPMSAGTCAACFADRDYFQRIFGLTRRRLEAAAALDVCVLSAYMRAELVGLGMAPERIQVVGPAVRALAPGEPGRGPGCVLFVGRLVEAKGVWDAVEAWRASGLDSELVVAGTGPLRGALERAGVAVTGWLGRAELQALYRRAELVLMPSRWQEPFGIVGLEALAMGVPVAAWESGAVAEWHPGRGLVAWGDVSALAEAARALAGSRAVAPAGFEPEVFATGIEGLFERIAGR